MTHNKAEIKITGKCIITDEELEAFKNGWGGSTPCNEYGMCETCPWHRDMEDDCK